MMKNAYTHIKRWKIPIYSLSNPAKISFFYVSWLKLPGTRKIKWGICFCFFSFIMISSTLQLMSTQLLLLRNEVRSIEGEEETDCDESRREEQIGGEKRRWCRLRLQKLMLKSLCPSSRDVLIWRTSLVSSSSQVKRLSFIGSQRNESLFGYKLSRQGNMQPWVHMSRVKFTIHVCGLTSTCGLYKSVWVQFFQHL